MGAIIATLPDWCVETKTTANGFQGGFIRRDTVSMFSAGAFPAVKKGIVIESLYPVVADLALCSYITSQDKSKILAGALCNISVEVYDLKGNTIPSDLATLDNIWKNSQVLPYDSNMYSATLKDGIQIPLSKSIYLIIVSLDDHADIASFPAGRSMSVQSSISVSGVPADKQQEFFVTVLDQIGTIVQRLDTEIAKFTGLIQNTENITTLAKKMDDQTAALNNLVTESTAQAASLSAMTQAAKDEAAAIAQMSTQAEAQLAALTEISSTFRTETTAQVTAIQNMTTQIQASTGVIDYSSTLAEIKTDIETLHNDLSGL